MFLLRLLYKPLAIIGGLISGRIGRTLFRKVWARIDDQPPPAPGDGLGSTAKVVTAQALQAAVFAGTAAAVDRTLARFFHHIIGTWPKKAPEPDSED